jgi:hypothetical protein
MVAVYGIAVLGWSKGEAIREMTEGGFGFQPIWSNLSAWIQGWILIGSKRKAGIRASNTLTKIIRRKDGTWQSGKVRPPSFSFVAFFSPERVRHHPL